eukprot:snap_masked-scaffold_13-processed-gene-7.7-mRNA-1 protein AED:0.01 eAED:0.02 QI:0/-1/0/1/-1/1/1/0/340
MEKLGKKSTCSQVLNVFSGMKESTYDSFRYKTIIVTGANAGIGKVTAQYLAYYGATVVLACRSEKKANEAIEWIKKERAALSYGSVDEIAPRLKFLELDLSSLESVKKFVVDFEAMELPPLRALILNAGLSSNKGLKTKEGIDVHFGVNHLGHMLLTKLLLPTLKRNAGSVKSRVVVLASESHRGPFLTKEFDNKQVLMDTIVEPKNEVKVTGFANGMKLYANSKLCNVLFAQSLNEMEFDNGVVAVSLHPGTAIGTNFGASFGKAFGFFFKHVVGAFTKSVDQGSSTTLTCLFAPEDEVAGKYFSDCKAAKEGKFASGEAGKRNRDVLWELSEDLLAKY